MLGAGEDCEDDEEEGAVAVREAINDIIVVSNAFVGHAAERVDEVIHVLPGPPRITVGYRKYMYGI